MCQDVMPPHMMEMPPDHHMPTPRPHQSIFHEMMVSDHMIYLEYSCIHFPGRQCIQQPGHALHPPPHEGGQAHHGLCKPYQPFSVGQQGY